jgi:hypothetical protein
MVQIKLLKNIEILSCNFQMVWDKDMDGGFFNWGDATITVGIKSIKKDPMYTYSILSHEIMEAILTGMGARFSSSRTRENYLFSFDHQTFENAIQLHAQAILKFTC